jgi:predicted DNA-binding transcriptional regulator
MVVQQPQMASKLIQLLSERTWTAYKQLENLKFKDPMARIYDTLLTQVLKMRLPIEHRIEHSFEFGPAELVKMIGLNEQEGMGYIQQLFSNKKFMEINGKIHTTDLEELEKQVKYFKKMQEMVKNRELSARKMG